MAMPSARTRSLLSWVVGVAGRAGTPDERANTGLKALRDGSAAEELAEIRQQNADNLPQEWADALDCTKSDALDHPGGTGRRGVVGLIELARRCLTQQHDNIWALAHAAEVCPSQTTQAIVTALALIDCQDPAQGAITALHAAMVLELAAEGSPDEVQHGLVGIAESIHTAGATGGGDPLPDNAANALLTCAALSKKAAQALGARLLAMVYGSTREADIRKQPRRFLPARQWIKDALGAEAVECAHPECAWLQLLLQQHLTDIGAEALLHLLQPLPGAGERDRACWQVQDWLVGLVTRAGSDRLATSMDGSTDPAHADLYAFVQGLEMKAAEVYKQAQGAGTGQEPLAGELAEFLGLTGSPTTGAAILQSLWALCAERPQALSDFYRLLQALAAGGAWHEIELWISLQVTRYLEDASVAAAAGASAAPPVDMLLQLVNRLVSEEHGAATRLKGVFQRQWGRLAQILPKLSPPVSAGAIATTRSVLKLLSATYTPEVSAPPGWGGREGATVLVACLLGLLGADTGPGSQSRAHLAALEESKSVLVTLACTNIEVFSEVGELLLDAMLVRDLSQIANGPCSQGLLALIPAVSLDASGDFLASEFLPIHHGGTPPSKRQRVGHVGVPARRTSLLAELRSSRGKTGPGSGQGHVLGRPAASAPPKGVPGTLLQQPQRLQHIVDVLDRCMSPADAAQAGGEAEPGHRSAAFAKMLQGRLDAAFGQPPSRSVYEDSLPRSPTAAWHQRCIELLQRCPWILSLVVLIAKHGGSAAVSECGTIVRAALADCIVRTAIVTQAQHPSMIQDASQILFTLRHCDWAPHSLTEIAEILECLPVDGVHAILMAVWRNASSEVLGAPAASGSGASREDRAIAADADGAGPGLREQWRGTVTAILHKDCARLGGFYGHVPVPSGPLCHQPSHDLQCTSDAVTPPSLLGENVAADTKSPSVGGPSEG